MPRERLEQRRVAGAQAPALRGKPAAEGRRALDLQALEEIAFEERGEGALALEAERGQAFVRRPRDFERIHRHA